MAQLEAQVHCAQTTARQAVKDAAASREAWIHMQLWAKRLQRLEGSLAGIQREQVRHRGARDDGADSIPSTRDHPADTNDDPT